MNEHELELINCIRKYDFVLINRKLLMDLEEKELALFGVFNGGVWRYSDSKYDHDLYINVSDSKFFFTFFQHLKNCSGVHLFLFLKNEIPELVYDILSKEHISFDILETFCDMESSWVNVKNNIEKGS